MRADDEQPVFGSKLGERYVGETAFIGCDQASIGAGSLPDSGSAVLLIEAGGPVDRTERCGEKALPLTRSSTKK